MVGAMITMYAAVANRTAEIGTLRAAGLPAHGHPDGLPGGGAAAGAARRRGGPGARLLPAVLHGLDHQLPDLRRAGLPASRSAPRSSLEGIGFALVMGLAGGAAAGLPRRRA
ncbi:MAG: hypothetical protein MZV70_50235 [Desulfobacterales bacterium]|nr:hypothetical protein [Desulfobacterales bacterium]